MLSGLEELLLEYALLHAVVERDVAAIQLCLSHGAPADTVDAYGRTPLMLACIPNEIAESNVPRIVALLLEYGANPRHRDCWNRTPLQEAASVGNLDLMRQLIAAGASISGPDQAGMLPLHSAVLSGHVPAAWEILRHCTPVEVNAPDSEGNTPLILAVEREDANMALLLLENGARTYPRNLANLNAAAIAWSLGADDILQILYQHHCHQGEAHA